MQTIKNENNKVLNIYLIISDSTRSLSYNQRHIILKSINNFLNSEEGK